MVAADAITVDGETISRRVWLAVLDAAQEVGIDPSLIELIQGSYSGGSVAASGSTHDGGGALDLRLRGISDAKAVEWCVALRKRGTCAWPRIPMYGWNDGRHIHGIDRFEPDLSSGARWQVGEYDAHRNGLTGAAYDPIPHPPQHKFEEDDMAITADDLKAIAEAVWSSKTTDPVTGDSQSERTILNRTRINSKQAVDEVRALAAEPPPTGTYTLTDADKDDIASRVADLLAIRLKG